jgi:HTH-type transcriptional regulator/antitoxin HipB
MAVKISPNNAEFVGQIILLHRKKAGLSRQDLAMVAGVGKTAIFDMEHGKKTTRTSTLLKVLNALNISLLLDSPLMGHLVESNDA